MNVFGREKWVCERSRLKRWAYRLFGEVHVPGRIRANHVLREIRRLGWDHRPVRVLDAGSGRGDLSIYLARRYPGWHITGIELSEDRVAIARAAAAHLGLRNIEFRVSNLEQMNSDSEFDLIVSADVLEHIENDVLVMRNLFRALAPEGRLVITAPSVPQRRHLRLVQWRERRIGFHPSEYGHVRDGYGKEDIRTKFEGAGGQVVDSRFTFGFFGTLAFDVFFTIGDNRPNPVMFAVLFPFLLGLGLLDLRFPFRTGSAILAVGRRPIVRRSASDPLLCESATDRGHASPSYSSPVSR